MCVVIKPCHSEKSKERSICCLFGFVNGQHEKNIDIPVLFAICYTINMTNITEIHDISAVLRAIRAHLDLTQEQLADRNSALPSPPSTAGKAA